MEAREPPPSSLAARRSSAAPRRWGALLPALVLAACGPLPRPFEHQRTSALVAEQAALVPLAVRPVDGAPDLAKAVVSALEREDIAATTETGETEFLVLSGAFTDDGSRLTWRVLRNNGNLLGETSQSLPAGAVGSPRDVAAAAARALALLLRGADSGIADLEARPHVAVRPVKAPSAIDADALTRAMVLALGRQGLAVDTDSPSFLIDGALRMSPSASGQDLLQVDWTVRRADGKELGTVSQGSPVPHQQLLGPQTALARDIADAGAEGVDQVIRNSGGAR